MLNEYAESHSQHQAPQLGYLVQETHALFPQGAHMLCGPVIGRLLQMLVQISGAKRCLELGTFSGYSALWIASGLCTDGTLLTCDIDPRALALARRYFEKSPFGHKIQACEQDALCTIAACAPDSLDFVFMDADKQPMLDYYEQLLPKLRPGALLLIDNVLWKGEVLHPQSPRAVAIDQLNAHITQDKRVENILLTVRDGLQLIRKI